MEQSRDKVWERYAVWCDALRVPTERQLKLRTELKDSVSAVVNNERSKVNAILNAFLVLLSELTPDLNNRLQSSQDTGAIVNALADMRETNANMKKLLDIMKAVADLDSTL